MQERFWCCFLYWSMMHIICWDTKLSLALEPGHQILLLSVRRWTRSLSLCPFVASHSCSALIVCCSHKGHPQCEGVKGSVLWGYCICSSILDLIPASSPHPRLMSWMYIHFWDIHIQWPLETLPGRQEFWWTVCRGCWACFAHCRPLSPVTVQVSGQSFRIAKPEGPADLRSLCSNQTCLCRGPQPLSCSSCDLSSGLPCSVPLSLRFRANMGRYGVFM